MPITGCAYYPEHWPRQRWEQDAAIMREAGLSVVRLAEFAWDKLQPSPAQYDFAWLDEAIAVLSAAGLKIVLCTPTPTPPPWLTTQYPDINRVTRDGTRIADGGRRHATANAPAYLDASREIVTRMCQHFGEHPALIGWQVDNEFGCGETTRSYGLHDQRAFRRWLVAKYETLDALNAAWGTQFWGMTYTEWEQIPAPGIVTEPQSYAMLLDFNRFSSDAWVRFLEMQKAIIQRYSPGRWITHNLMIKHWSLDYWKLAAPLDFVSYDNYPHGLRGPAETAMNLDLMWSLKRQNFWVMEQQPGVVNWHAYNPPVPPNQVRTWSHQAVGHGAEAIVYFRFRMARYGQEQRHGGLLKHDATPDQCFTEAQAVATQFAALPETLERQPAEVGLVFDYDDLWAIELEPHHQDFSYWELAYALYAHHWEQNIAVDFLPRMAALDGYKTVIVPAPILIHPREAEKWRPWVERGGRLIITFRAGVRELSNITTAQTLPGGLTDLIGAQVSHAGSAPPPSFTAWPSHRPGQHIQPDPAHPDRDTRYKIWAEALTPTSAEPLLHYADGMLAGQVAATLHKLGAGAVIYLGCWLHDFGHVLGMADTLNAPEHADTTPQPSERLGPLKAGDGTAWELRLTHGPTFDDPQTPFSAQYTRL